ncbi:MAG: peroxiredoxin [Planctomycetaceae bacterium]|nr:peroxiredoxin [Planctomycetaceae bacterium]
MRKPVSALVAAVIGSAAMFGSAHAADVNLKVGDKAPVFTAKDDTGKEFKSTDVVGKKFVVVYFYPADLTGGCTAQACGFRDDLSKLTEKDVLVLGVSGDSVENHQIFKKEKDLNFPLLADEDGAVAKAFGVPVSPGGVAKVMAGGKQIELRQGVRAKRWTFLIDKEGKIALKNEMVKAADDSKAILKKIEELKK